MSEISSLNLVFRSSLKSGWLMKFSPVSEAWVDTFKNNGISRQGVKLVVFDNGLRGAVATSPPTSEPLVTVKADVVLEVTNDSPPSPFPDFVPNDFWKKCMWDQRLGLKLLYEMKNISSTAKSAWIDQLPKSFSTPLHWNDELIKETQYSALDKRVSSQRESWQSFYKRWTEATSQNYRNLVSQNDMYNVLECCNSRAFSGAYEGSSSNDRKALLIFTILLSVLWPVLNLSSIEQSIGLGITVGFSILIRDLFLSNFANLKRYVLCPYVDMFNHRSSAVSDVSFNYFKSQFELVVSNQYQVGEQVFISYGKPSNDRLLQFYGFIEENNPYDVYDYSSNILELILKYADNIKTDCNDLFPVNPDPTTRLKLLATAMQNTNMVSKGVSDNTELVQTSLSNAGNNNNDISTKYFRTKLISKPNTLGVKPSDSISSANNMNKDEISQYLDHYDDITIRSLRVFFSTEDEWNIITKNWNSNSASISLDEVGLPLSSMTEGKIATCLKSIAKFELLQKSTSLEYDTALLKNKNSVNENTNSNSNNPNKKDSKGFGKGSTNDSYMNENMMLATMFRIEKKKILIEAMQ